MSDQLVTIGRVVKPHGIRGEVVVDPLTDVPGRFDAGSSVHLGGEPTMIAASRPHQGRVLIRFEGVTDRTAAELLRGRAVEAEPIDVARSEAYFVHELVGLPVLLDDGRELGTVLASVELPDAAAYDLLEVERADGSTWLLPAVDDYVEIVLDAGGRTPRGLRVVDPPEGLLDDQEQQDPAPRGPGPGRAS